MGQQIPISGTQELPRVGLKETTQVPKRPPTTASVRSFYEQPTDAPSNLKLEDFVVNESLSEQG